LARAFGEHSAQAASGKRRKMNMRQCPYCGIKVAETRTECLHCHAVLPEIQVTQRRDVHAGSEIRKGLLYVLLAAVIKYFAGGYSAMQVPFPIQPIVTTYLSPVLFLGGLGLTLHGYFLQRKAWTHTVRYR
jgi:hypothetical protein